MVAQTSPLCRLPFDILENIGVEVAAVDPLGPPKDLVPLLLTCKAIHNALSFNRNPHLYARIFRCRFDVRASKRRFSDPAHFSSNLAQQLRVYSASLSRIRRGDLSSPMVGQDLWSAFFLMVENDGRNEAQLEWAGLRAFIARFVGETLWLGREIYHGWPAERSESALALWLMWATLDAESLANETPDERQRIMELVRPYVVAPFRYPPFHAPDNHFYLPLPEEHGEEIPYMLTTPHGLYPPYRRPEFAHSTVVHYGIELRIAPPLISTSAKLIYFSRTEAVQYPIPDTIPATREAAIALGNHHVGPTQEDFQVFNSHKAARLRDRGDWDWRSKLSDEDGKLEDDGVWRKSLKSKSSKLDNDWNRWRYCFDLWHDSNAKGVVYTFGCMNGSWAGRMLVPDNMQYFHMVRTADFVPHVPAMTTVPISFRLREHHCINPQFPALCGGVGGEFIDDGIMNAWFPNGAELREGTDDVIVHDRSQGLKSKYETFTEGKPNSHNEDTCTQCRQSRVADAEQLAERAREHQRSSSSPQRSPDDSSEGSPSEGAPPERKDPMSELHQAQMSQDVQMPFSSAADIADARSVAQAALGSSVDVDELLDAEMLSASSESTGRSGVYEEFVTHECNGIQDIIITGETLPKHSLAWHRYKFYGRVRHWDGLVALVRAPAIQTELDLGVNIFRGYLHANETFVGHWRTVASTIQAIPFEGPFIASRAPDAQ